ncbi:MAG: GxxExxY protein [Acidobacteriia bacterium]|nr:GxxExxY protein [Terriglobia bacterium]
MPASRHTPETVSRAVLDAAMRVHTNLGPGLLENAYRACLQHELIKAGHKAEAEVTLPVVYDGIKLDVGYRLDLLVDDCVIVELKTAERITPVYEAQIISYLKLSGKSLGLLINFKVAHLRDGIKRFVNGTGWRNPNSP